MLCSLLEVNHKKLLGGLDCVAVDGGGQCLQNQTGLRYCERVREGTVRTTHEGGSSNCTRQGEGGGCG
ncbi:hypothetical protein L195_g061247, partial [Trifolium pratense]